MEKINVGVIFGGKSVEHEISIITSLQAAESLDQNKYNAVPIYIAKNGLWYTSDAMLNIDTFKDIPEAIAKATLVDLENMDGEVRLKSQNKKTFGKNVDILIDICLVGVHGTQVEDGTLAGYLEMKNVPYTGCRIIGAAIGQDKVVQKEILKANKLSTVDFVWFFKNEYLADPTKIVKLVKKECGFPVIVKPANLGSSIGISKAIDEASLDKAIKEAAQFDHKILVEKCLEDMIELNCSVLGDYENCQTSAIERVMQTDEILSYKDKYQSGGSKKTGAKTSGEGGMASLSREVPAKIDAKIEKQVRELSENTFRVLNGQGVVRIDFMVDKKGKVYMNEVNTIPGSLSYYLWEANGMKYSELLDELIKLGYKQFKDRQAMTFSIDTNVLANMNMKK